MSGAIDTADPAPIPDEELNRLFPLKLEKALKAKSYEFALVLGGTVSAGAYTAGVLDYICEALDLWTRAKLANQDVPKHNAVLSTVVGSSGGAINGAILTRIAGFAFPHGPVAGNPHIKMTTSIIDYIFRELPATMPLGSKRVNKKASMNSSSGTPC